MRGESSYSVLFGAVGAIALLWIAPSVGEARADAVSQRAASVRSSPPDRKNYTRPAARDETSLQGGAPLGPGTQTTDPDNAVLPRIFVVDTIVNNTNRALKDTDTFGDQETSTAVNLENRNELVVSAFSGFWGFPNSAAPIFQSVDRGRTWTKQFSVRQPPGWGAGCPCDQTYDYGRNNELSGAILGFPDELAVGFDVVTGTTRNPARAAAFKYFDPPPNPPFRARETNANAPGTLGNADQPWLLANRAPAPRSGDNVYVAYADLTRYPVVVGPPAYG
jgi:hypothetical protein